MTPDTCTLESIGGGAAGELFSRELEEVLDNIADVNTNAEDERSITITVTFKPSDDRTMAGVAVAAKSKLAPVRPHATALYFGRRDGKRVAVENNPRQAQLFDAVDSTTGEVTRRTTDEPLPPGVVRLRQEGAQP